MWAAFNFGEIRFKRFLLCRRGYESWILIILNFDGVSRNNIDCRYRNRITEFYCELFYLYWITQYILIDLLESGYCLVFLSPKPRQYLNPTWTQWKLEYFGWLGQMACATAFERFYSFSWNSTWHFYIYNDFRTKYET